jgi:hypothetical protein
MTPQQRAAKFLFGFPDYVPHNPDHQFPRPDAPDDVRVSYNELVAQFTAENANHCDCHCGVMPGRMRPDCDAAKRCLMYEAQPC